MLPYDPNRVEVVFSEALSKPSVAERIAFLDQACADDKLVRQRVDEILRAHDEASGFLDRPAAEMMRTSGFATEPPFEPPTDAADAVRPRHAASGQTELTQGEQHQASDQELNFLAASKQPGHLGRLGPYEIQAVIGRGGFGIVLKAFDERLHRVVAVKVLSPAYAVNAAARKRFASARRGPLPL